MLQKEQYNCSLSNNLNKSFHYAFLLFGLLMLPFLGFSQEEQPKRVTVVVTAKEITPQKVVQLPADNVPTIVSSKPKIAIKKKTPIYTATKPKATLPTATAKKVTESSPKVASVSASKNKAVVKENAVAKATPKPKNTTPPPAIAPPVKKEEVITKTKPAPQPQKNLKEADIIAPPAPITTANTPQKDDKVEEPEKINDNNASVKADYARDTPQLSPDGQTNTISYIWIGVFLIIAGVVLGLLFGKPAFLISFVGVVFVALGMII